MCVCIYVCMYVCAVYIHICNLHVRPFFQYLISDLTADVLLKLLTRLWVCYPANVLPDCHACHNPGGQNDCVTATANTRLSPNLQKHPNKIKIQKNKQKIRKNCTTLSPSVFVLKESHKIETSETISINRCQPILDLRAWSAMGLLAPDSVLAAHGVAHVVCACAMRWSKFGKNVEKETSRQSRQYTFRL